MRILLTTSILGIALLLPVTGGTQGERFTRSEPVASEPVVTDSITGLAWQGCPAGLSGAGCTLGSAGTHTWQAALAYCEDLDWGGSTDWRLPDVKELGSIVDDRRVSPSIDVAAFPGTPSGYFLSSSSYAGNLAYAWYVTFSSGHVGFDAKGPGFYLRCVRGGP